MSLIAMLEEKKAVNIVKTPSREKNLPRFSVAISWTFVPNTPTTIKVKRSSTAWGSFYDEKTINVTVNPSVNLVSTITPMTYYVGKACLNETISLKGTATSAVTTWVWDLGDGSPFQAGQNITYKYTVAGVYTVKLYTEGPNCLLVKKHIY